MFKTSLIAAAAIASAVSFASTAAKADPHISVGIGLGFGGGSIGFYDGGYGGYDGYGDGFDGGYQPRHHRRHLAAVMDYSGISCSSGANKLRRSGFRGVSAYDCSAPVYSYQAWKHGEQFDIRVNLRGNIVSVEPAY